VSEIGIAGKMVEEEFERLIQKYLPCYMDIYDEIHHRQSTSPVSDSDSSKSKKSKVGISVLIFQTLLQPSFQLFLSLTQTEMGINKLSLNAHKIFYMNRQKEKWPP
jgi:hypothetical protein